MLLGACATTNSSINKKEYKRSKSIAIYSGMTNELEDGYLVLKENGYFKFYEKWWLGISIKENEYIGHYSQKNDTLFLDWLNIDPKQIKNYCLVNVLSKRQKRKFGLLMK